MFRNLHQTCVSTQLCLWALEEVVLAWWFGFYSAAVSLKTLYWQLRVFPNRGQSVKSTRGGSISQMMDRPQSSGSSVKEKSLNLQCNVLILRLWWIYSVFALSFYGIECQLMREYLHFPYFILPQDQKLKQKNVKKKKVLETLQLDCMSAYRAG